MSLLRKQERRTARLVQHNPELEMKALLIEGLEIIRGFSNQRQGFLFDKTSQLPAWDLLALKGIVRDDQFPLVTLEEFARSTETNPIGALDAAQAVMRGQLDIDVIEAEQLFTKKAQYDKAVGNTFARVWTNIRKIFFNAIYSKDPVATEAVVNNLKHQIYLIESGQVPEYREAINLALALGWYGDFRSSVSASRNDVLRLTQEHPIFKNCTVSSAHSMSGLYANALTRGSVVDEGDGNHVQSKEFTHTVFGVPSGAYGDIVDEILANLGRVGALQTVNTANYAIQRGKVIKTAVAEQERERKSHGERRISNRAIFNWRLDHVLKSLAGFFEAVDNRFSLTSLGAYGSSGMYKGLRRGDNMLDPDQVHQVLKDPEVSERVIREVLAQGVSIAPKLSLESGIPGLSGRNARRIGRLRYIYEQLDQFGQLVLSIGLSAHIDEGLSANGEIDWKQAAQGRVSASGTLLEKAVSAVNIVLPMD